MYTFVDKNGVLHFSNVPSDPRFVPADKPKMRHIRGKSGRIIDPKKIEDYIRAMGDRYQVDPMLIKAVIKAESNFNCLAVSKKGAQGLMQLMPGTAEELRVYDPFDPWQNIKGGTCYLRKMLTLFDEDLHLALAAYNAGPEKVKNLGRIPKIPETVNYIKRVLRHYKRYQTYTAYAKGG